MIDSHAHLDQDEFQDDLAEVCVRARQAGLESIVSVGTTAASSAANVALAERYQIQAAVGIQPNYTQAAAPGDWDQIVALAAAPRVVALGETGLDRHWDYSRLEIQEDYFDRHLRLAQERNLPFIVHTRESDAEVLRMLADARRRGPLTGVMHSFTGSAATAEQCVELGLFISFAGMVTFKKSTDLRNVAATVPLERLLIETDSPYLSPQPLRGRRNEPAHLVHTATCLAGVRGIPVGEFAALTAANARKLFRL